MPKRLDVLISAELDAELTLAEYCEDGIPRHDRLRRGLAVLKAFSAAKKQGLKHLGFTSDPSKLDVEVVNVL